METWRQLSENNLLAAEALLQEGQYRSCVSRAYYAAYCAVTHEIRQKLITFSRGRNNPSHEYVPRYIQNNLTISQAKKDTISTLIITLRNFREDADYRPQETVDEQVARDCVRDTIAIQQELWGSST